MERPLSDTRIVLAAADEVEIERTASALQLLHARRARRTVVFDEHSEAARIARR